MQATNRKIISAVSDFDSLPLRTEEQIMSTWTEPNNIVVSCCAISFNQESYIEFALKSMLMQETDFAFEIIIRDDASTDNTQEIIRKYQSIYPNIIKPIFESENGYRKGVRARMVAMNKAQGSYIAPLDCDDYWTRDDKLQNLVGFLRSNPDYAMCFHNAVVIDNNSRVINENRFVDAQDLTSEDLIIGRSTVFPSFTVFKNIGFDKCFPSEFNSAKNGDTITWHLIGFYGPCKYIDNFSAGAFRIHSQGQNSGLTNFNKIKNRIITRHAIITRLRNLKHQKLKETAFNVVAEYSVRHLMGLTRSFDIKSVLQTFEYLTKLFGVSFLKLIIVGFTLSVKTSLTKKILKK